MIGIGVVACIEFPRYVIEIEVVLLSVAVQVEGDGLHVFHRFLASPPASALLANLFVGDGSLVDNLLPLGSNVVATIEDAPINIVVGCGMRLSRDVGFLVGTHLHAEAVFLS